MSEPKLNDDSRTPTTKRKSETNFLQAGVANRAVIRLIVANSDVTIHVELLRHVRPHERPELEVYIKADGFSDLRSVHLAPV